MVFVPLNFKLFQSSSKVIEQNNISLIQPVLPLYPVALVNRFKFYMNVFWIIWVILSIVLYAIAIYQRLSLLILFLFLFIVFSIFLLSWSYLQNYKFKLTKDYYKELNQYFQKFSKLKKVVVQEETKKFDFKPKMFSIEQGDAYYGLSESSFKVYLENYFNVKQGLVFKVSDKYNYTADFIISHSSGLMIDVEIDEPYALRNAEPTHCIDQLTDRKRNHWFCDQGYVVIRFSEYQVVIQPESCCYFIAKVIFDYTGDLTQLNRFGKVLQLVPQYAWNTQEAKMMIKKQYRASYLPSAVIVKSKKRLSRKRA